ncbi:hypothetical protein A2U01_0003029 [Trifolium medium]|uniref:Uncharacterized protein n=1 Tax=Trifolium medium TaxID=97028 RepID=A0A392M661_9FABA|nr:hypothetical protein [Trifolium medium]
MGGYSMSIRLARNSGASKWGVVERIWEIVEEVVGGVLCAPIFRTYQPFGVTRSCP